MSGCRHCGHCPHCGQPTHPFYGQPYYGAPWYSPPTPWTPNTNPIGPTYGGGIGIGGGSINTGEPYGSLMT